MLMTPQKKKYIPPHMRAEYGTPSKNDKNETQMKSPFGIVRSGSNNNLLGFSSPSVTKTGCKFSSCKNPKCPDHGKKLHERKIVCTGFIANTCSFGNMCNFGHCVHEMLKFKTQMCTTDTMMHKSKISICSFAHTDDEKFFFTLLREFACDNLRCGHYWKNQSDTKFVFAFKTHLSKTNDLNLCFFPVFGNYITTQHLEKLRKLQPQMESMNYKEINNKLFDIFTDFIKKTIV